MNGLDFPDLIDGTEIGGELLEHCVAPAKSITPTQPINIDKSRGNVNKIFGKNFLTKTFNGRQKNKRRSVAAIMQISIAVGNAINAPATVVLDGGAVHFGGAGEDERQAIRTIISDVIKQFFTTLKYFLRNEQIFLSLTYNLSAYRIY